MSPEMALLGRDAMSEFESASSGKADINQPLLRSLYTAAGQGFGDLPGDLRQVRHPIHRRDVVILHIPKGQDAVI
jgi:hypothetical protein